MDNHDTALSKWARRLSNRFKDSRFYSPVFAMRVKWLTNAALRVAPHSDESYRDYVRDQIARSAWVSRKRNSGPPLGRTMRLVELMRPFAVAIDGRYSVLCIGCRDVRELDYISEVCQADVRGVDLFSADPRIDVADMHQLPYPNGQFDCVYSCHSLEHAYDIDRALSEFVRVTKPGGLLTIEVPTGFRPEDVGGIDRHDVGSVAGLLKHLDGVVVEVLAQEDAHHVAIGVTKTEARVVVRVNARAAAAVGSAPNA